MFSRENPCAFLARIRNVLEQATAQKKKTIKGKYLNKLELLNRLRNLSIGMEKMTIGLNDERRKKMSSMKKSTGRLETYEIFF